MLGEELWLFHRGNESEAGNVVAEIGLSDLAGSLTGDLDIDVEELKELREYDLGEMDGVALCFSDATALSDELVCFTASAEGEEDGDIHGSVVGTISAGGEVRRLRTIDRKWKVEGVHAAVDTGVIDFVFVCDQDDEAVASPLLTRDDAARGGDRMSGVGAVRLTREPTERSGNEADVPDFDRGNAGDCTRCR